MTKKRNYRILCVWYKSQRGKNESNKSMTCLPCILMKDSIKPKYVFEREFCLTKLLFNPLLKNFKIIKEFLIF